MIDWEMVIAVATVIALLGSVFLFVLRAILKPLEQLIQSNTEMTKEVVDKMEKHETRLQCVEIDIARAQEAIKHLEAIV